MIIVNLFGETNKNEPFFFNGTTKTGISNVLSNGNTSLLYPCQTPSELDHENKLILNLRFSLNSNVKNTSVGILVELGLMKQASIINPSMGILI